MLFLPFSELSLKNKNAAVRLFSKYEPTCVQLISHFKKSHQNFFVVFVNEISPAQIYGVLYIGKTLLHCLPFASASENSALQRDFLESFAEFLKSMQQDKQNVKKELPSCISGLFSGTNLILKSFEKIQKIPCQINDYDLMKLDIKHFCQIRPYKFTQNEKIIRCKNLNLSQKLNLIKLQEAYEKEEVLPKSKEFDEDSCRLRLSSSLRTQTIFAIDAGDDRLVAKAGTNAIGIRCAQIGGVFTSPECRNRHYAHNLLCVLLKKIVQMKKLPVLFVKKSNQNAVKLYEHLKFIKISEYKIAYF